MITRSEFLKLLGLGFLSGGGFVRREPAPWDDPDWLLAWQSARRIPVVETEDPPLRQLLTAIRSGHPLVVRYHGGSSPGIRRLISPAALFEVEGFSATYLTAHCHERNQPRHFRCDLLEVCG